MKMVISKQAKRTIALFIGAFLILTLILNVGGYFLNLRNISVLAANAQIDKYETRSALLMESTDKTGVCLAMTAAEVWASGLKQRSAALQYCVMTKVLKNEYAKQLEQTFPNWVTGVSSPWVDSYKFIKCDRIGDEKYIYIIRFSTKTSAGPAGDYNAEIAVEKEGNFWRITKVNTDRQLYVYTGFKP